MQLGDDGVETPTHEDLGLVRGLIFWLVVLQLLVEVRAEFGVFCLDVDCYSEDGAGVDKALGEDAEDGLVDLTSGRYDESCDGKGETAK